MLLKQTEIDYTNRDFQGFKYMMIEGLKKNIPEYTDFSDNDFGIALIEALSMGLDIQSYYLDRVANEVLLNTATQRYNVIELCSNYGYTLRNATPSILEQVFEVEPTSTGIIIPKGFRLYALGDMDNQIYFELDDNLFIPPNKTGLEQDEHGEYLYKVKVIQGYTISEELLGSSNGTPNQTFALNDSPVITDSIEVFVNEGQGFRKWKQVPNFLKSDPTDMHYQVKVDGNDKASIVFGNDSVGKIPDKYDGGILCTYRVGGGIIGNVTTNSVIHLSENLANIKRTFNIGTPLVLGFEKEDLFSAKRNAINGLRTLERAVTLQDFEDLAYLLPFTVQARAEEVPDGRTVNIYILPNTGNSLNDNQLEEANKFYHERKMLGTKPVVLPPKLVPLNFKVTATRNSLDTTDYEHLIPTVIQAYFKLGNFKFKQPLSKAQLTRECMDILFKLEDLEITVLNTPSTMAFNEILTCGTVEVTVKEVTYYE